MLYLAVSGIMVDGLNEGIGAAGSGGEVVEIASQDFSSADLVVLGSPNSEEYKTLPQNPDEGRSFPLWAVYGKSNLVTSAIEEYRIEELKKKTKLVWSIRKPYILSGDQVQ